MPISNRNQWKLYLTGEAYKASVRTTKLLAAGKMAQALAIVVHADTSALTRHEKRKHAEARALVFAQWAHLLDDETVEFICCDKCLSALMPKAAREIIGSEFQNRG